MGLARYHEKRDFSRTPEPRGRVVRGRGKKLSFVIQKHAARRLHYDFRLELDGVLKSWAVPKGPSFDPAEKRLAVEVEDHPLDYGGFEGTIPKGEYGGGAVLLWDRGTWTPIGDPRAGLAKGRLEFELAGEKLSGAWHLVRMGGRAAREGRPNWLLIKSRDASADARGEEITAARPESVASGRVIEEIAAGVGRRRVWHSNRGEEGKSSRPAKAARSAKATRRSKPARPATISRPAKTAARSTKAPRSTKTAAAKSASAPKLRGQRSRGTPKQRTRSIPTSLASIPGSRRAGMPRKLEAELATLVDAAPEGDGWLHEIKFDGYRVLVRVRGGRARWITRRGQDWSARMRSLDEALLELPVRQAVFDGEVVVLRPDGTTSFQDLQNAFGGEPAELTLYLFDLLYVDGRDLRGAPLEERKRVLEDLCRTLPRNSRVRYSEHVTGFGAGFHAEACRHALEGIVSKRRAAPYRGGRQTDWQKTKCQARQEFVVGGWTDPQGAREVLGALLVGVHEDGELRYAGKVGSGYDRDTLQDLRRRLKPLALPSPAFVDPPRGARARGVHWVRPELVVEVEFTGWTDDGSLRHPTFQGIREDKRPEDVVREQPAEQGSVRAPDVSRRRGRIAARDGRAKPPAARPARRSLRAPERDVEVAGVRLTHAERVLWPEEGITKLDLARYYERVAERILPHVEGRPVSIVRCPEGRAQACFFQRHAGLGVPPSVRTVEVDEQRGRKPYLMIDSLEGLIGLVQIGALELHPWGARADRIEKPDRIVFDLDPAPGVEWSAVLELAREIRARLAEQGLESFPKTTGGKGLHVVVPLARRATWKEVKPFAERLAKDLAREAPDRVIAKASKEARRGRIFVDWLRNARGASAIAPYSTRSREHAPVAMPVGWKELSARLRPDQFTIANAGARLAKPDPWASFQDGARPLPASARR